MRRGKANKAKFFSGAELTGNGCGFMVEKWNYPVLRRFRLLREGGGVIALSRKSIFKENRPCAQLPCFSCCWP